MLVKHIKIQNANHTKILTGKVNIEFYGQRKIFVLFGSPINGVQEVNDFVTTVLVNCTEKRDNWAEGTNIVQILCDVIKRQPLISAHLNMSRSKVRSHMWK